MCWTGVGGIVSIQASRCVCVCGGVSVSVPTFLPLPLKEPENGDIPGAMNSEYPKLGFQILSSTARYSGHLRRTLGTRAGAQVTRSPETSLLASFLPSFFSFVLLPPPPPRYTPTCILNELALL